MRILYETWKWRGFSVWQLGHFKGDDLKAYDMKAGY
jgi:hypothetical protein